MPDTLPKVVAGLTGVALVGVIAVGAVTGSQAVARDLRGSAERALAAHGLDGVVVDFTGREAELSGGSRADLVEAETIVEGIRGVRRADVADAAGAIPGAGGVATREAVAVPTFALERTAAGTTLAGTVRDADTSSDIKAAVADAFGGTVRGDLTVDPEIGRASWTSALPDLLDGLGDLAIVRMVIDGSGTVVVDGRAGSRARADEVAAAMAAALPDLDLVGTIAADPDLPDPDVPDPSVPDPSVGG